MNEIKLFENEDLGQLSVLAHIILRQEKAGFIK